MTAEEAESEGIRRQQRVGSNEADGEKTGDGHSCCGSGTGQTTSEGSGCRVSKADEVQGAGAEGKPNNLGNHEFTGVTHDGADEDRRHSAPPSGSVVSGSGSSPAVHSDADTPASMTRAKAKERVLDTSCVVEMPVVEEDTCAICLDEFTDDDPGMETECGHVFHIQCLMQWRSRSDECPMCFQRVRLVDVSAQELLEEVEPNTISMSSRRTSSEAGPSNGPSPQLGAEEDLYSSGMELLLRMMNQHPSARATQSLERALQETIMLDDYMQHRQQSSSARQNRMQRRTASEDNTASESRRRRRDGSTGDGAGPTNRGRGRSASGAIGNQRAVDAHSARGRSGSDSSGPSLRSRWQAASSRARESLMRASQEIRTRIRGKQQEAGGDAVDAGTKAVRGAPPPTRPAADRAAEVQEVVG